MVFQKPTPFPMSIYDNTSFGVGLHRSSIAPRWTSAWVGVAQAALWERSQEQAEPGGMSPGRADNSALHCPRARSFELVVLLDKPAIGIDPDFDRTDRGVIDELKEDFTIVIVTHNMQQAAQISDLPRTCTWGTDRIRRHRPDLHEAKTESDGRIHHRRFG